MSEVPLYTAPDVCTKLPWRIRSHLGHRAKQDFVRTEGRKIRQSEDSAHVGAIGLALEPLAW